MQKKREIETLFYKNYLGIFLFSSQITIIMGVSIPVNQLTMIWNLNLLCTPIWCYHIEIYETMTYRC